MTIYGQFSLVEKRASNRQIEIIIFIDQINDDVTVTIHGQFSLVKEIFRLA